MNEGLEKVAVLGLDGLGWPYLRRVVESGHMPYLRRLLRNSYKFELEAYPPVSPPSWSNIMTGVNPGKHGIFSFDYLDRRTLKQKLYTALELEHPRVHEMLAFSGIPSVVINPIPTYPLMRVRGTQVLSYGLFTPRPVWYPDYMRKYVGILTIEPFRVRDVLPRCARVVGSRLELVKKTALELDWRLYWVNLSMPDVYLHKEPCLVKRDVRVGREEAIVLRTLDKLVAFLDREADALILASDHGFGLYDKVVSVNDVLYRRGLVRIASRKKETAAREHEELMHGLRGGRSIVFSPELVFKIRMFFQRVPFIKEVVKSIARGLKVDYGVRVDISRSTAFMASASSYGIYVKEPCLIDEVVSILTGYGSHIRWVRRREEVFWGPYVDRAPEVLLCPRYERGCKLAHGGLIGRETAELVRPTGGHHDVGVLVVRLKGGPELHDGLRVPNYVVGPLVMALLGVPLPHDHDAGPHLRAMGLKEPGRRNYLARWRVARDVSRLRVKKPSGP
ncbi:hypothetical protein DRO32_04585 [Candidatus Bathyarchaeota archaeon]|nr:MAG: hypothetical protein DRO32_04585 [Candidatus Bathyarchaeota archaeon]